MSTETYHQITCPVCGRTGRIVDPTAECLLGWADCPVCDTQITCSVCNNDEVVWQDET